MFSSYMVGCVIHRIGDYTSLVMRLSFIKPHVVGRALSIDDVCLSVKECDTTISIARGGGISSLSIPAGRYTCSTVHGNKFLCFVA